MRSENPDGRKQIIMSFLSTTESSDKTGEQMRRYFSVNG